MLKNKIILNNFILFKYMALHGEGNGNPLQYSCLGNPWTKEPGGLQSMGSQRSDTTERLTRHMALQETPSLDF